MRKFWNWVETACRTENACGGMSQNNAGNDERTLYLNGAIAEETWWGDEITPKMFRDELLAGSGECGGAPPITVWINSPGGDMFAAAQIYNMLMDYTGQITVKIDGIAASAASVIAMAGGEVYMSPVSMLMVHNPSTIAIGDSEEMLKAKAVLDEIKESIINAYELKTGLSRTRLSHLMNEETWMNAHKAVVLGFADKIMFTEENTPQDNGEGLIFSRMAVTNSLLSKFPKKKPAEQKIIGTPIESLDKRLSLISH